MWNSLLGNMNFSKGWWFVSVVYERIINIEKQKPQLMKQVLL